MSELKTQVSFETEAYAAQPDVERVRRVYEALFSDPPIRPEPQVMAEMIRDGLTEADLYTAGQEKGYEKPVMEATLRDLDRCLPFIERIDDALDSAHPEANTIFLFAARDAELLYDYFAITRPDRINHLMPASMPIWGELMIGLGTAAQYAEPFLEQYDMSREALTAGETQYIVIDTGFRGTVVYGSQDGFGTEGLVDVIKQRYGIDMRTNDKLIMEMVCLDTRYAHRGIHQIINLEPDEIPQFERNIKASQSGNQSEWTEGNTHGLAVAMQTMPRYKPRYASVEAYDGQIVAVSVDDEEVVRDIDATVEGNHNASAVSPLAAAIVQFRVVQAALQRLEQASQALSTR